MTRDIRLAGTSLAVLLQVLDWDWQAMRSGLDHEYVEIARKIAEAHVAGAFDRARGLAPDIAIETDALTGSAVSPLLEAATDAELLVVGARGRGGFAELLLGSVSQHVTFVRHVPRSWPGWRPGSHRGAQDIRRCR